MAEGMLRVTIEIEPHEPIHGRIFDAAGAEQEFRGWLELSAALERARRGTEAPLTGETEG